VLPASTISSAKLVLGAIGLYDLGAPASYRVGARTPERIPIPDLPASPAPALAPTPAGEEPGLMDDLLGMPLTRDNVEEVLDEMVRPALNADGGDISLIKIEGNDIYVRLVGACSTCPSSVMTMKMGVERLLQEEFPDMGELIQVDEFMSV
jgi:Fe-S cluster biogenesis protein NfuA